MNGHGSDSLGRDGSFHRLWADVVRLQVNVHQHWHQAKLRDREDSGSPGQGRGNDLAPRLQAQRRQGYQVGPGDFAENLTCQGVDLVALPLGTRVAVGDGVVLEISQIGKECHAGCAIFKQAGKCIMPKEGVFARVIKGGTVSAGDEIGILENHRDG